MFRDCDHLLDEHYIYTIRGNWPDDCDLLLAKPVYNRTSTESAYVKIVDQKGSNGENLVWLDPTGLEHLSSKGIADIMPSPDSLWFRMALELQMAGIPTDMIGIFGSHRLRLPRCRDVDFIIYGRDNMYKLKAGMDRFKRNLGLANHTVKHASYQVETHGRFYAGENNDLLLCLLNKWSTCAFTHESTSTIRFVDESDQSGKLLKDSLYQTDLSQTIVLEGIVSGAENTSFIPRRFELNDGRTTFQIISPLWIFHQCVKDNDLVRVTGALLNNHVILRNYDHGIKFI